MSRPAGSRDRFEDYVPVAERLEKFYERFPEGRVTTSIVEHNLESGFVLMRAEVFRNPDDAAPAATGHAFEVRGESYVNKTSYIENAETSSVGRALALLGFEVKRGIASREELQKTARMQPASQAKTQAPAAAETPTQSAVDLDREILQSAGELGYDAAKVRKWVNQKFKVTEGLDSLSPQDKREVLKIFREKAAG
ncbi:MAG: hypothetical protein QOF61_425 [Acidobacteriota bacterium]|jgi:hypothetical protein|nr:hypothetical protein [Acidobacteriota bacterium]